MLEVLEVPVVTAGHHKIIPREERVAQSSAMSRFLAWATSRSGPRIRSLLRDQSDSEADERGAPACDSLVSDAIFPATRGWLA